MLRRSACFASLLLTGCSGLLGLDDFTDAGGGGAPTTSSAAGLSSSTADAVTGSAATTNGSSSASTTDAGVGGAGGDPTSGTGGDPGPGSGGGTTSSTNGTGGNVPECEGDTVCVPDAPNGWTGPAALYIGDAPPEECPAPWNDAIPASAGDVRGAHTCSPCTCGDPAGAQCSNPQIRVYGTGTCGGSPVTTTLPANGNCIDTGGGYGARGTDSVVNDAGTCPRGGGALSADPPTWDDGALVCGFDGGLPSCSGGVCAPAAAPPLGAKLCVYKDGEEPGCPLDYPMRTILHRGQNDTRGCSACTCALPTGVSCPDVIDVFSGSTCTSQSSTLPGTACKNDVYYQSARFVNRPVGGSCAPQGGNPTGELSPTLPLTVCCLE